MTDALPSEIAIKESSPAMADVITAARVTYTIARQGTHEWISPLLTLAMQPPADLKSAVVHLQNTILTLATERDEAVIGDPTSAEQDVVDAAVAFVRKHRASSLFGDSVEAELDALNKALTAHFAADIGFPQTPAPDLPYLYILMRNDLGSMNPGKAVAQGSHGANQMVFETLVGEYKQPTDSLGRRSIIRAALVKFIEMLDASDPAADLLAEWMFSAKGFGHCICLSVTEAEMRKTVSDALDAGLHAGITHDPSYPLRDGGFVHLIPLDTCGFVFARKSVAKPFVGTFSLMA